MTTRLFTHGSWRLSGMYVKSGKKCTFYKDLFWLQQLQKHGLGLWKGVFGLAMCKSLNTNAASLFQQWAAESTKSSANQWNAPERESVYSWGLCRVSEVLGSCYLAKSDSSGRTQDLSWEGVLLSFNKTNTHDVCQTHKPLLHVRSWLFGH